MPNFFAKEILVDQNGKAINFKMYSFGKPNMRALHLSWLSFMVAFFAWFAVPPLAEVIVKELNISPANLYDSNVAAVSVTIAARLIVGPLCERYGPRRVMAALLIVGSIPSALVGLVKNGAQLIIIRCFIGILGATFVPCQFWATQMFSGSVVGSANAIVGGWGNMGAGVSYLLLTGIHTGLLQHLPENIAWRLTFFFPTIICMIVGILDLTIATDTPNGDWLEVKKREKNQKDHSATTSSAESLQEYDGEKTKVTIVDHVHKVDIGRDTTFVLPSQQEHEEGELQDVKKDENALQMLMSLGRTLCKPSVLILICHYACSFGSELAIDNVIGHVFIENFQLDSSTAAYIGSIFGLLNICSRFSGGLFSDILAKKFNLSGRLLAQLILMSLEGCFLIGFAFCLHNLTSSIVMMIFFSFFVQAVCGSTYAIVPFVDPANSGKVIGLVGSGGNFGGLLFNIMFKYYKNQFQTAFIILGGLSLGCGILGCFLLRVQGKMLYNVFSKQ
ncbi:major facilitator superfamily domain-containing protein [Cunninghamella echinulata]|nr:major facilitator superfamily domain-containing protein [Cunninghamella echinulata]